MWLKCFFSAALLCLAVLSAAASGPSEDLITLQPDAGSNRLLKPLPLVVQNLCIALENSSLALPPALTHVRQATDASSTCKLQGQLELQGEQGQVLQQWVEAEQCGVQAGQQWVELLLPEQLQCQQCRIVFRPQAAGQQAAWSRCISADSSWQEQPWIYRVAGHLANAGTAAKRRLLQEVQPVTCASAGALVTGYGGCVYVTGEYPLPIPNKHFVHWTVDSANGGGVSFAVEVAPIGGGNSWAGLGWSPQGNPAHPPQMINATAVMGWVDIDNNPHVEVFDLWAKNVEYIQESYDQFTVTDTSIEYIQQNHLVLRFRRKFDTVFRPDVQQRMITAHGHRIRGLSQHGHRAALFMDASGQGSMRVTSTRLSNKKVQAHAWCMFIAFGIILPIGIIWARYFRDVWGKWYMLHLGIQAFGLLLAVAAFLVAVTQNNPIPRSLAHFQLGLAVIILAVLQPLNSLPRLTMHHGHVRRSIYWAYLHWLCGRVTIAFAWVNMFLGVGRYRTWFNLGSWPEGALGLYFGAIILVCTILESRLWRKGELRAREENDELSRRIAELENRTDYHSRRSPSEGKPLREEDDDDLLDQVTLRHNAPPLTGDSAAESTAKDDSDLDQVHPDSQDRLKKGNKVY